MELKPGYKQTEVGVIPEDWNVVSLDTATSEIGDGIHATPTYSTTGAYYFINGNNLRDGQIVIAGETKTVDYSEFKKHQKNLSNRSILMSINGSIGNLGLFDSEAVILGKSVAYLNVKDSVSKLFIYHSIQIESVTRQFSDGLTGTTIRNLGLATIRHTKIALPPTKAEQEAIAEALSDADALIESLEQLIAKKRQTKQGTMQELLTGKRCILGFIKKSGFKKTDTGVFPEDWEIVPLKQISTMHGRIGWQGLKQSEFTMNSDDPFLITGMNFKAGEIRWNEVYHVPWTRYEMAKEIQLKTGDVLMTKDGTIGKILYVDQIPYPGKATLNSHLLVFRPLNNKYIPKFLFYQLNFKTFYNHIEQEKSGTTFFGITQEAVGKYKAFLPSIPEQSAIAEILSDMDTEIAALEAKLAKARYIKQGMMQELLTGRIRLI